MCAARPLTSCAVPALRERPRTHEIQSLALCHSRFGQPGCRFRPPLVSIGGGRRCPGIDLPLLCVITHSRSLVCHYSIRPIIGDWFVYSFNDVEPTKGVRSLLRALPGLVAWDGGIRPASQPRGSGGRLGPTAASPSWRQIFMSPTPPTPPTKCFSTDSTNRSSTKATLLRSPDWQRT